MAVGDKTTVAFGELGTEPFGSATSGKGKPAVRLARLAGQSCSLHRINRPSSSGSSWLSRGSPAGPGRSMVVNGNYSFALRFPAD